MFQLQGIQDLLSDERSTINKPRDPTTQKSRFPKFTCPQTVFFKKKKKKVQTGQNSNLPQNKGGCIQTHCRLPGVPLQWLGTSPPTFHYWPPLPVPDKTAFC